MGRETSARSQKYQRMALNFSLEILALTPGCTSDTRYPRELTQTLASRAVPPPRHLEQSEGEARAVGAWSVQVRQGHRADFGFCHWDGNLSLSGPNIRGLGGRGRGLEGTEPCRRERLHQAAGAAPVREQSLHLGSLPLGAPGEKRRGQR